MPMPMATPMAMAPRRRPGALSALWLALCLLCAAHLGAVTAQTAMDVSTFNASSIKQLVVELLENNLPLDQPRLIVMQRLPSAAEMFAPKVCGGFPGLITRLSAFKSNNACFSAADAVPPNNLSCSCLEGYNATATEWAFQLKRVEAYTAAMPTTLPANTELGVGSLIIFGLPAAVQSLKLSGVGGGIIPMEVKQAPFPGIFTDISIVETTTTLRSLLLENMDLSKVDIKQGFVPSSLESLTMRNCNLSKLTSSFLSSVPSLTHLDVSGNHLQNVYEDTTKDTCTVSSCKLQAINLTSNNVTTLPTNLLNFGTLKSLSLRDNHMSNYSLSQSQFETLNKLTVFEADSVDASQCMQGKPNHIQNVTVCVIAATQEAISSPSKTSAYLMYGIIVGCVFVAFQVFIIIKCCKRRKREASEAKEPLGTYFDNTLSWDDTPFTVDPTLLNDPIIITSRIEYKDIRVANCVSKGGFGLVYSGVFNRRRVAIKKIRPDKSGDMKQIELFLKEICLIATLNHPRIVEFIGVAWDSLRNLCAVTEFMERGDLREVLHGLKLRNCGLTWESHKMTIALHIAEALVYLHSLTPKVIHRDLKSKNVLLNADMEAKLSDFGISRERRVEETHMTAGIGTSFWIAPEVLTGQDYDERADIFSYGVVLSEIDTDDYPYWNSTNPHAGSKAQQNMILQMVASGAMRPTFSDSCPKAVLDLADMCLQANPELRPTAAQIVFVLQQYIQPSDHSSTMSSIVLTG